MLRKHFTGLLPNTGFILSLALVFGLVLNHGAEWTRPYITPLLAIIVTLSITSISPGIFLHPKTVTRPIIISLVLNYGILSFALVGMAYLIIPDYELWTGFIIIAAVPAAVAVIPFSFRLRGNVDFSLIGTLFSYIAAIGIVPLAFFIFMGGAMVNTTEMLITMSKLIATPLAISQLIRKTGIALKIEPYRGHIVNWGFFIVVYTVIGLNRNLFIERPDILLKTSIIGFVSTFVIAIAVEHILKRLGIKEEDRVSMVLLATRKNYGLAAAIALAVIGPEAAMPSAVASVFNIIHFIWYSQRRKEVVA